MDYVILKAGGKQYRVKPGDVIDIDKIPAEEGSVLELTDILASSRNGEVTLGRPLVPDASVLAQVQGQVRDDKIIVFKYKRKVRYRRKKGHRQHYTRIEITSITVDGEEIGLPEAAVQEYVPAGREAGVLVAEGPVEAAEALTDEDTEQLVAEAQEETADDDTEQIVAEAQEETADDDTEQIVAEAEDETADDDTEQIVAEAEDETADDDTEQIVAEAEEETADGETEQIVAEAEEETADDDTEQIVGEADDEIRDEAEAKPKVKPKDSDGPKKRARRGGKADGS